MSHAGAVKKTRLYDKSLSPYRSGAQLTSRRRGRKLGEIFDEGHRDIEDTLYSGEKISGLNDPNMPKADLEQSFPSLKDRYLNMQKELRATSQIESTRTLMCHLPSKGIIGSYDDYNVFGNLVNRLYDGNQEIFEAGIDFIYGDKMKTFAKKIDQRWGEGTFKRLYLLDDDEQAQEMLDNLEEQ